MERTEWIPVQTCSGCDEELDEEGRAIADEREGYSGCCNKRVEYTPSRG